MFIKINVKFKFDIFFYNNKHFTYFFVDLKRGAFNLMNKKINCLEIYINVAKCIYENNENNLAT